MSCMLILLHSSCHVMKYAFYLTHHLCNCISHKLPHWNNGIDANGLTGTIPSEIGNLTSHIGLQLREYNFSFMISLSDKSMINYQNGDSIVIYTLILSLSSYVPEKKTLVEIFQIKFVLWLMLVRLVSRLISMRVLEVGMLFGMWMDFCGYRRVYSFIGKKWRNARSPVTC